MNCFKIQLVQYQRQKFDEQPPTPLTSATRRFAWESHLLPVALSMSWTWRSWLSRACKHHHSSIAPLKCRLQCRLQSNIIRSCEPTVWFFGHHHWYNSFLALDVHSSSPSGATAVSPYRNMECPTTQPVGDPRKKRWNQTLHSKRQKDASSVSWGKANITPKKSAFRGSQLVWPSLGLVVMIYPSLGALFPVIYFIRLLEPWRFSMMETRYERMQTHHPASIVNLRFGWWICRFEWPIFFLWFFRWNHLPTCTATTLAIATFFDSEILLIIFWLDLDSNLEGTYNSKVLSLHSSEVTKMDHGC